MKEYRLPEWIGDFVENQLLTGFEKKSERERKEILYGIGRIPLEAIQGDIAAAVPEQDEDGRYVMKSDVAGFPDRLMEDIHNSQAVQETLTRYELGRPRKPFRFLPVWTPREMEKRIRDRDWKNNAWAAGSHTGCDLYVLYMNVKMGLDEYLPAYDAAMMTCSALQSAEDGMWGYGSNKPHIRVNGTMKVLSKVHFVQECYMPFADKMVDYVLEYCRNVLAGGLSKHDTGTVICSLIDIMFCFEYAVRMTDHRRDDITDRVYSFFPLLDSVRRDEGFGGKRNLGLLQGTIRRAAGLCGLEKELGWAGKKYRFPD